MGLRRAAAYLDVSPETLHSWAKAGRLRVFRLGPRTVRYHRDDLDALAAGSEIRTSRQATA